MAVLKSRTEITNKTMTDEQPSGNVYSFDFTAYDNSNVEITEASSTGNSALVPTAFLTSDETIEQYLTAKQMQTLDIGVLAIIVIADKE